MSRDTAYGPNVTSYSTVEEPRENPLNSFVLSSEEKFSELMSLISALEERLIPVLRPRDENRPASPPPNVPNTGVPLLEAFALITKQFDLAISAADLLYQRVVL